MPIRRRTWLMGTTAAAASSIFPACTTRIPKPTNHAATGFYQYTVGKAKITAVQDGITPRPLDAGFVRNAPLAQVQATLANAGLPTTHIDMPYTCFVVDLDGHRYLLDTGFADNGAPGTGLLHSRLRAAGIDPASIDRILISHMHGDHIHGLRRKDGSLVYPKATVYVPQPEAAFWMDDARMQALPENARGAFLNVRRVFTGYPNAQIKLFTPGTNIAQGIETIATFGHTPGHTAIAVQSGAERFTYIADATNYPALFVKNPDWQVQFDMEPEQARASRHALLARLAQDGSWVGGYHFPLPGIGRIQKAGNSYDWLPRAV